VRVLGLTPPQLAAAREGAEPVLAVFVGGGVPAPDVPAVAGELRVEGETLIFEPRFPFVPGLRYTARLRLPGRPARLREFDVPQPAGEPPRVTHVFPSGDTLPENTLRLYVHFSQPMDAHGATRHVRLFDAADQEVPLPFVEIEPGLWDPRQTRLTLLFHPGRVKRGVGPGERLGPPLREGGAYRLVVDAGLRSGLGQTLAGALEKHFRVGPADRTAPRAADLRVAAPDAPHAPLAVTLPEPLDEGLLRRLLWVEDGKGRRLEGAIEIESGETLWRFRPAQPWLAGTYSLRVHPALEDRAGNRFDRLFDREAAGAGTPHDDENEPFRLGFQLAF